MRQMRTAAEINKTTLFVERHIGFRKLPEELHFVCFATLFEKFDGFLACHLPAVKGQPLGHDLRNPGLDSCQVFLGKRPIDVKIVIEAIFDGRPNGYLRLRKQPLDRLSHDMRGAVAQDLEAYARIRR